MVRILPFFIFLLCSGSKELSDGSFSFEARESSLALGDLPSRPINTMIILVKETFFSGVIECPISEILLGVISLIILETDVITDRLGLFPLILEAFNTNCLTLWVTEMASWDSESWTDCLKMIHCGSFGAWRI